MEFMCKDFLLQNETAKELYSYADKMPIVDYHSHVSPQEIAENQRYDNITQLWLGGDHYKWRLMRWCGIEEKYITGNADDKSKFRAFAGALEKSIGNPVYHWAHLELKRYFRCDLVLGTDTADKVWDICNKALESLTVRDIIEVSNVKALCTTDDPIDDLHYHMLIAQDNNFHVKVLPTFRPDKAINIHKQGFAEYIKEFENVYGNKITSFNLLCDALSERLDFFIKQGCKISDHGLDEIPWSKNFNDAEELFQRGMRGEVISPEEAQPYQTALLLYLAKEYADKDIAMQLHYGVQRNVNPTAFASLGPDTGFDCVATPDSGRKLGFLLGEMSKRNGLPKTILYSLNPSDSRMLSSLAGSFQRPGTAGYVQHGSAWWFNDTKKGMEEQLLNLAETGVLPVFIGMLTDSRSFTSYTRHEYFRRVLCNTLGKLVENGEYPYNMKILKSTVEAVSYTNAVEYLGL